MSVDLEKISWKMVRVDCYIMACSFGKEFMEFGKENLARLNAPLPFVFTHTSLVNSLDQDLTALLRSTIFAVPSGSFEL